MVKKVSLDLGEYNTLISIVACASKILDKYVKTENKKMAGISHIMDSKKRDGDMRKLYLLILYNEFFHNDVQKILGGTYLEMHPESLLSENSDGGF